MTVNQLRYVESMQVVYEVRAADRLAPLTEDEITFIAFAAAEELAYRYPNRPGGSRLNNRTVRMWLEDPATWSPFVDEVAIRRALAFDWDVIENLSRLEVRTFIDRLLEMEDPFEREGNDPHRLAAWTRGPARTKAMILKNVLKGRGLHDVRVSA